MSAAVMYEEAVLELKEKLDRGLSAEGAVEFLHAQGLTITQSMKALVEVMNVSQMDAQTWKPPPSPRSGCNQPTLPLKARVRSEQALRDRATANRHPLKAGARRPFS